MYADIWYSGAISGVWVGLHLNSDVLELTKRSQELQRYAINKILLWVFPGSMCSQTERE